MIRVTNCKAKQYCPSMLLLDLKRRLSKWDTYGGHTGHGYQGLGTGCVFLLHAKRDTKQPHWCTDESRRTDCGLWCRAKEEPYIASMGIYVAKASAIRDLLLNHFPEVSAPARRHAPVLASQLVFPRSHGYP